MVKDEVIASQLEALLTPTITREEKFRLKLFMDRFKDKLDTI